MAVTETVAAWPGSMIAELEALRRLLTLKFQLYAQLPSRHRDGHCIIWISICLFKTSEFRVAGELQLQVEVELEFRVRVGPPAGPGRDSEAKFKLTRTRKSRSRRLSE
jgi:hypothetical protein